jgi:hypothetical protein
MVDVVRPERRTYQLLEEISLLVAALSASEPRERAGPVSITDLDEPCRRQIQCFLPRRLAEVRQHLVVVDEPTRSPPALAAHLSRERSLRIGGLLPDQRGPQSLGMARVVESEPPLHTQALVIDGTLPTIGVPNPVLRLVREIPDRTPNTAVRADRVDGPRRRALGPVERREQLLAVRVDRRPKLRRQGAVQVAEQ